MELKVEARNVELKKGWQIKIEEEKEKLLKHHAGFVLHLRVSIEATTHHKEGGYEVKIVASVPNDTVVVTRKGEMVRPLLIEAFDVLALQLKEILRKKRKTKKQAVIDSKKYSSMILFSYSTEHLLKKDKIRFYYALKGRDGSSGIVKSCRIDHLGRTVLLVPVKFAKEVEEFLELWKCRFRKKEVLVKK